MKNYYSLLLALFLFSSLSLKAQTFVTWTGAVSDRYEDPANWVVGDSIDETDGITGYWADSLCTSPYKNVWVYDVNSWIKTWDPTSGRGTVIADDGVTEHVFPWIIRFGPSENPAVADTASHLVYNDLTLWTRPVYMYVDSGANVEIAVPYAQGGNGNNTFYVNKDIHINGQLTLRDTAFVGSRNAVYLGTAADGEVIVKTGATLDVKAITRLGSHSVVVDTVDNVPVETVTDYIGKVIVRGGTVYPGGSYGLSWGASDIMKDRENGSCVVIDSGMVNAFIRDFEAYITNVSEALENPLVIINGGEFQSLDNYDLLEYVINEDNLNIFQAGNGGNLVLTQMDGYVSITNDTPVGPIVAVEKVKDLEVNVYPNPAVGGNFTVNVPSGENVDITVYNAVGQAVYSNSYSNQGVINVNAELNRGIYVVEISSKSNNSFATQKLIVQ